MHQDSDPKHPANTTKDLTDWPCQPADLNSAEPHLKEKASEKNPTVSDIKWVTDLMQLLQARNMQPNIKCIFIFIHFCFSHHLSA